MTVLVLKIISMLMAIVGTSFLIPIITAIACREFSVIASFAVPMIFSWIICAVIFVLSKKAKPHLSIKGSFTVVALSWIAASLFGAVPLFFSGAIPDFTNAVFESVSGFTTTGATILEDIESLPKSINMWRCLTHWLGGMGIVALTVALLPILGIGGFQLIKAETTGPEKGKFTARITTTAKILWLIYFSLTVIHAILLKLAGMDLTDAVSHAFSTMGSGGFSTRNSSIASFNSSTIEWICCFFMFLAGINFTLYYYVFARNFDEIKANSEFRAYLLINLIAILSITLIQLPSYGKFLTSLRYATFQVTSILSTTGYATCDFLLWKPAAQFIIFSLLFIGGCSGSTGGGVKVVRWVILYKHLKNEFQKMIHPHGVFSIRLNHQVSRTDVLFTGVAFFALYFMLLGASTFFGCLFGMDLLTSFSGSASMIGNVGPAFNLLGPSCNFNWLASPVKWWYCIAMIAGRLELFTIAIFLSPAFWKK